MPSWGDAPLRTTLKWEIGVPEGETIGCTLDADGDGKTDYTYGDCPKKGTQEHVFETMGVYRPVLTARTTAGDRATKSIEVYANNCIFKDNVRFPDEAAGYKGATLETGHVRIEFANETDVPAYAVGDIVWGVEGQGYVREVTQVSREGSALVLETKEAYLEDAILDCVVRYNTLRGGIRDAKCTRNCGGVTVTLKEPVVPKIIRSQLLDVSEHYYDSVTLDEGDVPLGEGMALKGVTVDLSYALDFLLITEGGSVKQVTWEVTPALDHGMTASVFKPVDAGFEGEYQITLESDPSMKFAFSMTLGLGLSMKGDIDVGVEYAFKGRDGMKAGLEYKKENGKTVKAAVLEDMVYAPEAHTERGSGEGDGELTLTFKPAMVAMVMGEIAKVNAEAEAVLKGAFEVSAAQHKACGRYRDSYAVAVQASYKGLNGTMIESANMARREKELLDECVGGGGQDGGIDAGGGTDAGGVCQDRCPAERYSECVASDSVRTCEREPDGCLVWGSEKKCPLGCETGLCKGCTPEGDPAFCARLVKECGPVTGEDNCLQERTADCGSCTTCRNRCVDGACEATSHATYKCDGRDVYWYDTCDTREEGVKDGCGVGQVCNTDACCTPEDDGVFCGRLGFVCGDVSGTDNCGSSRNTNCGNCGLNSTCDLNKCKCLFNECSGACCANGISCGKSGNCCEINSLKYVAYGIGMDIKTAGHFAFAAQCAGGLKAYDLSDVSRPAVVGEYPASACTTSVAVSGNSAYVADTGSRFSILDISDPTRISLVANYYPSEPQAIIRGAAFAGQYAFVVWIDWPSLNSTGIDCVDLTVPDMPVFLGRYVHQGDLLVQMEYGDGLLFLEYVDNYYPTTRHGLDIINVTNPSAPRLESSYMLQDHLQGFALEFPYIYSILTNSSIEVINAADPTNLVPVGVVTPPEEVYYLSGIDRSTLFAIAKDSVLLFDLTTPSAPICLGTVTTLEPAKYEKRQHQAFFLNYLVNLGSESIQVVDLSDIATPRIAGRSFSVPSWGVAVSGEYAYAASTVLGLIVADLSTPTDIVVSGEFAFPEATWHAYVADEHLFLATDHGAKIFDISTPGRPSFLSETKTFDYGARWMQTIGNTLYVFGWTPRLELHVFDISNVATPTLTHTIGVPDQGSLYNVASSDKLLALLMCDDFNEGRGHVLLFDIGDPTSPKYVSSTEIGVFCYGLTMTSPLVWVSGLEGFAAIDVSDPSKPVVTKSSPEIVTALRTDGEYLYMGGIDDLSIAKFDSLGNIDRIGKANLKEWASGVEFSSQKVIVFNINGTLEILDISSCQ
jgi:hypothetical protein